MTKNEFRALFLENARRAIAEGCSTIATPASDEFDIELHGAGVAGESVSLDQAVDRMYLTEDSFYSVIDVGVKKVVAGKPTLFVRISAYPPTDFDHTWNTPKGAGPFKIVLPLNLR
ncbi:MAG TPA: hypothetical protein VFB45_04885 [Pseudolabrys sp.]|nr:hypothetical protein [Pseudolabrys sp.]